MNINCQNYDLMLFFYRLLFEKCSNYSKKDFSLFVLSQQKYQLDSVDGGSSDEITIEFQISLKNDDTNTRTVEKLAHSYLVYNVDDRRTFDNIVNLLGGFIEPIVPGKFYSLLDPDGNRVYLIDRSTPFDAFTHSLFNSCMSSLASSVGLANKYYSLLNSPNPTKLSQSTLTTTTTTASSLKPKSPSSSQIPNNYSPNSNCSSCSSTSETSSFDSGKDSGNWSGGSATGNPTMTTTSTATTSLTNVTNASKSGPKPFIVVPINNTSSLNDQQVNNNNNGLFSKKLKLDLFCLYAKKYLVLFNVGKDFNYKELHSLSSNYDLLTECQATTNTPPRGPPTGQYNGEQAVGNDEVDYLGVKHLIKKFNANPTHPIPPLTLPNPTSINVNMIPMNLRSSSATCRKPTSSKKRNAVQVGNKQFNHSQLVSGDSEDYDEYSGDDDEDNEK